MSEMKFEVLDYVKNAKAPEIREEAVPRAQNYKGFKLYKEELPPKRPEHLPLNRMSIYARILMDFSKSDAFSVRIGLPGTKPDTLYTSLIKARKSNAEFYRTVNIHKRGTKVYLSKKD